MNKIALLTLLVCSSFLIAQTADTNPKSYRVLSPELMLGISAEANENFPDRDLQKQLLLGFGQEHKANPHEWAYWLKAPKTGLQLGITDFGNSGSLGYALTVMPYIEFDLLGRRKRDLKMLTGMGVSYFNKKFDQETNFFNQAITTDLTWSFRAGFLYEFLRTKKLDYRIGVVYFHHSNGHTRLPNQGINSFLGSFSIDFNKTDHSRETGRLGSTPGKTKYSYFSGRFGYGINVLSLADPFNDKKPVYTVAGEYGKVWNKTYKLGIGFHYRFYQHYFDYIDGNESLVQEGEEFESYKDNAWWNASNLNVYINFEFLLNHVGIDLQLGANIFKPAYKFDWRINEGWDYPPRDLPPNWVYGEFTTKYQLKQLISSRMGLKYYLFGTNDTPKHNFYVGAHINANLGQADFTDLSLGYVYSFGLRGRD